MSSVQRTATTFQQRRCTQGDHPYPAPAAVAVSLPDGHWAYCADCLGTTRLATRPLPELMDIVTAPEHS